LFCPKCRDEFQDWVKTCPDCKVDLVAELPPASRPEVNPFRPQPPLDLRRLGNKKCPNCGKHQGWYRSLFPLGVFRLPGEPLSQDWKCAKCQTVLTYDHNRLLVLGTVTALPLYLVSVGLLAGALAEPTLLIFLPVTVPLAILALLWSVAIMRREE
jgi:hypothetical protein